jgi:hypothetical protein
LIGIAGYIRAMCELMAMAAKSHDKENEQWFLTDYIAACPGIVWIDYTCKLFYCCGGEWRRFAGEVVDGRFRNKRTGTHPYILHAPIPRRSLPIRERVARELGII